MKDLSKKINGIDEFIKTHSIKTVSFDIDGTLYPMSKVTLRWWLHFFTSPRRAMKFLSIRKKWEKRRKGSESVAIAKEDIHFFESFLCSLLDESLIDLSLRKWIKGLEETGIKVYFLSDHGAEVKLETLKIAMGMPLNCLGLTGELKPHKKISDLLIKNFSVEPGKHLHLGDRWTDEEQARLMGSHFRYFCL